MNSDPKKKPHEAKKASSEQLLIQDLKSQLSRADERVDKMEFLLQAIARGLATQDNLNQVIAGGIDQNKILIVNLSKFVDGLANLVKEGIQDE